jgi:hypothetical protein
MKRRGRSGRSRLRTGVVAVAVLSGVGAVGAAAPANAAPQTPNFGPGIDGYQPYVGQSTCDPTAKAGVLEFRDLVLATYPNTGSSGISRDCNQGGASEHKEGRAWDWRVSAFTQRATANDLLNWLLATDRHGNAHALARRLGIMYIIWDARIWKAYQSGSGWQTYPCEGVTDCHQDHVHFSFGWPGANRQTSWWTGRQPAHGKETVGFYRPSDASYHLRNSNTAGPSDAAFVYGPANMIPVVGDWNGDGKATIGFYRPSDGSWHLRNTNTAGPSDAAFVYGPPNMVPIVGDWNNDGKTSIGFYRPSDASFHLRNANSAGPSDAAFVYGPPNMKPVTGDWNGDGKTTIGFYRPSDASWHLRDSNTAGPSDNAFVYGPANMTPVTGDWNADGKTSIGFYRPSDASWHLRNANNNGPSDAAFIYGPPNMKPITGDWNNA